MTDDPRVSHFLDRIEPGLCQRLVATDPRIECERPGECAPVLVLYAPDDVYGEGPRVPVRSIMGLRICTDCRPRVGLDALIVDATWEIICRTFDATGHARPCRESTELDWEPLGA